MPEVILKKFLVSILIGIGCFLGGIAGVLVYHDIKLFALSGILFVGMIAKAFMIYHRFKNGKYTQIIGTVQEISRQLFASHKSVTVETEEGIVKLYLPKDAKIKAKNTYCFYFQNDTSKSPVIVNQYITAKLNTDNFIGCELVEDISEPQNESAVALNQENE